MLNAVENVTSGDEVINKIDMTQDEIIEFVDSFNTEQIENVIKFFETMPKLRHVIDVVNPKTKVKGEVLLEGLRKFFGIGLSHDSVENYYKQNFAMIQHHHWSLTELENMMPWERDIYSGLLLQHLEDEKAEYDKQERKNRRQ